MPRVAIQDNITVRTYIHACRANYNSLTSDICQVNISEWSGQVLLMPDHFCVVSDHAKLKLVLTDIMSVQQQIVIIFDLACTYTVHTYLLVGQEGVGPAGLPRPGSPADAMEVGVEVWRGVVVDDTADCREVHSPGQGIRAYQQLERQFYNVHTYIHAYMHTYIRTYVSLFTYSGTSLKGHL